MSSLVLPVVLFYLFIKPVGTLEVKNCSPSSDRGESDEGGNNGGLLGGVGGAAVRELGFRTEVLSSIQIQFPPPPNHALVYYTKASIGFIIML